MLRRDRAIYHRCFGYDNDKATYWLCKSAHQNYGPAQLKLARIYSGQLIEGVRLMKRATALFAERKTAPALALMWARLAASNGVEGAAAYRDELQESASTTELERAARLALEWRDAPCEWSDVFAAK